MSRPRSLLLLLFLLLGLGAGIARGSSPPSAVSPPPADGLLDRGLVHVHAGELRQAESLFVAQLSRSPRDARALTNLGNLALLRGDRDRALAFYDLAVGADSLDAELRVNRAIVLGLLGAEDESRQEGAEAHRLAANRSREALRQALPQPVAPRDTGRVLAPPGARFWPTRTAGALAERTPDEIRTLIEEAVGGLGSAGSAARAVGPRRPDRPRSPGAKADELLDPRVFLFWKR
jgi:tetratricopeptide (TPR) repeat protein